MPTLKPPTAEDGPWVQIPPPPGDERARCRTSPIQATALDLVGQEEAAVLAARRKQRRLPRPRPLHTARQRLVIGTRPERCGGSPAATPQIAALTAPGQPSSRS